jgi:hypothetical protein
LPPSAAVKDFSFDLNELNMFRLLVSFRHSVPLMKPEFASTVPFKIAAILNGEHG